MPPAGEALDDDYVIGLLKKDASANQKRYITNGLGSLLSKRPRGNAPKPNTRFLKNIIRETDSHNAALKAKEEEESRARFNELRAIKRKRDEGVDEGSYKRRRGEEKQGRWANVLGALNKASERHRRSRDEVEGADRGKKRPDRSDRSWSDRNRRKAGQQKRHHRRERERSTSRSRSDSPKKRNAHRHRSSRRSASPRKSPVRHRKDDASQTGSDESESDPLNEFLGPQPPPRSLPRGRGASKPSDMDSRFDPSYDPKTDVNLEQHEDRDDWDMALEALRDRAKWKAQGADRLRAAGFTDDEVSKWEKGGEKDIEDVKWRKKGEKREWDSGKVLDEDGQVHVKASWGMA